MFNCLIFYISIYKKCKYLTNIYPYIKRSILVKLSKIENMFTLNYYVLIIINSFIKPTLSEEIN